MFFIYLIFFNYSFANETKKVSIQLNWKYQFEFAGYIAAIEKGFYKDVGFDVTLKELKKDTNVIEEVKNNKATFGIYDSSILSNYDKKKPIILLANYLKKSPLVLITKQSIFSPKDLINKKIYMSEFEFENSSLSKLFRKFNIKKSDINLISSIDSLDSFILNEADAISAYITNQTYILDKQRVPYNLITPSNYEIDSFGGNLFASLKYVQENPEKIKEFIKATNKGWKYALDNKEELVDIIYEKYSKYKTKQALLYEANKIEKVMLLDVYKLGEIRKTIIEEELKSAKNRNIVDRSLSINDIVFSFSKYSKTYSFTNEEIEYLNRKKRIKMCTDPSWMPYEKIQNGKHIGIVSDYIKFFQKQLKVPIVLYETKSWKESLRSIKDKKCDILSVVVKDKQREKIMNITKPYLEFPLVIATKIEARFINSLDDLLADKKIGVVKSYAYTSILEKKYPNKKFVNVSSVDEGLQLVAQGKLFGLIDSITTIGYKLQNSYFSELKIAGKFDEKYSLGIGIRNDDAVLYSIFDKLVQKLDVQTKNDILKKWISFNYDAGFDYSFFWKIFLIFAVIVLIITYRYKELASNKEKIQKQREKLEQKNKELKATQNALKESVRNFEILLDSTMEAVLVFKDHDCIDINKVGYKLLGYSSKSEVLGQNLYHHVHDDFIVTLKESLNKNLDSYEIEFVRTDGTTFPALVKDRYINLNNERVKLFTIVDLTELKNKERLLFKQSKLASMGEMIGNIAHQWRQPLSLISTISTGLKLKIETQTDNKEESIEFLEKLNTTSQHLSSTIDDFRNFFKPDKKKERFFVSSLIEQNLVLLDSIFKTNFINIKLNVDENLELNTYKNELTQALLNILNNANDAFKQKNLEEKLIFIDAIKKPQGVVISIKDNAGGIPEEIIENIFEPYFTTKHKSDGTGIGLYMAYQIVHEHIHGRIEAVNSKFIYNRNSYKGAKFIITIPSHL
ncbi:BvgS-like domain-containing signal transduction sensor histidine kinase (NMT1, PAS domains) [Malaciobacter halophilus]|nr:BvgS-like domain-containing signal transduction sensor histidine kinase (NMT1, PAS domains) [Malaciobacter halophilus]